MLNYSMSVSVDRPLLMGPVEILLPYLVKNDLDGSARDLGMVCAAGGLGSVACALAIAPMLGRVSSLDWPISIGLLPLSFA